MPGNQEGNVDFGSIYLPPNAAKVVGEILRAPREFGHSGNFTDLFSSDREEQRDYIDGLLVILAILSSVCFIWVFVLIVLKCNGEEAGCASGRAFVNHDPEDEEEINYETDEGKTEDEVVSTSYSSDGSVTSVSSRKPLFSESGNTATENPKSDFDHNNIDYDYSRRMKWKWMGGKQNRNDEREKESDTEESLFVIKNNPHEYRTRLVFLFFASMVLICAPLTLFLTIGPLKEGAIENSKNLMLRIQNSMDEVESSLSTIDTASLSTIELVTSLPTRLDTVCPLVNDAFFESFLGVDIRDIIGTVVEQQDRLEEEIENKLSIGYSFVNRVERGLSAFEISVGKSEDYLWIIPALLLSISVLSTISILGVVLAWKKKSGVGLQRIMSYIVLPLLILAAITCWLIVVLLSLSTMVGTDVCLSSSSNGTPDQTIQEILSIYEHDMDNAAFQLLSASINQCKGPDPVEDIQNLKEDIQDHIDNIWRQVSRIDSVGRDEIAEKCGGTAFTDMLIGARDLAKLLTTIRRSLSTTVEYIGCDSISSMYNELAHSIICTEALSASTYGLLTFLIVWISLMVMISLRASWLRNNEEEKVYHDETEVAENMILDEYEEYLAYISRYKHEWQEYVGFEKDRVTKDGTSNGFDQKLRDEESGYTDSHYDEDSSYYYGSEELSADAYESDLGSRNMQDNQDDVNEGRSNSSEALAFENFPRNTIRIQQETDENNSTVLTGEPPDSPPPSSNPNYKFRNIKTGKSRNFDFDPDFDCYFPRIQPTGEIEMELHHF